MYGRCPRCKRNLTISEAFGCGVDRERLDQRGQSQHHLPHLAADARIFVHVRADHAGVRAQPQRLEHRHCRSHPEGSGDVAGRGDNAAPSAADDHRLGGKRGIVALLDRGVKGVAIDVGNGKPRQFVMAQQSRRTATAAARRLPRGVGQTVAAKASAHGTWRFF